MDDSWTPDEFNGDLLWIIEDSSYKNKTYSILSSTENSLIIQGLYDLAQGTRIAIITIDPDMADNFAEYNNGTIILDDEKLLGLIIYTSIKTNFHQIHGMDTKRIHDQK